MLDAGRQAANALHELAEDRRAHGLQLAELQTELRAAQRSAHLFELENVRLQAVLETQQVSPAAKGTVTTN